MTQRPTLIDKPTNGQVLLGDYLPQVLNKARWEQEMIAGTNPTDRINPFGCDVLPQGGVNVLTNGCFDLWQAGAGPVVAAGSVSPRTADGWLGVDGTYQRIIPGDLSNAMIRCTSLAAGAYIQQVIPNAGMYRSRWLTLSAQARGGRFQVALSDTVTGTGASAVVDATGGWKRATVAIYPGATMSAVVAYVIFPTGGAQIDVDNATLTPTYGPVDFLPVQPAQEWHRALKRYRRIPFHCRFYAKAAGEVQRFSYPIADMVWGSVNATAGLYGFGPGTYTDPSVTDNNIDIDPAKTLIEVDDKHVTVQVTAVFGATDTYIHNGWVQLDTTI
jgi:hypothetical protein